MNVRTNQFPVTTAPIVRAWCATLFPFVLPLPSRKCQVVLQFRCISNRARDSFETLRDIWVKGIAMRLQWRRPIRPQRPRHQRAWTILPAPPRRARCVGERVHVASDSTNGCAPIATGTRAPWSPARATPGGAIIPETLPAKDLPQPDVRPPIDRQSIPAADTIREKSYRRPTSRRVAIPTATQRRSKRFGAKHRAEAGARRVFRHVQPC